MPTGSASSLPFPSDQHRETNESPSGISVRSSLNSSTSDLKSEHAVKSAQTRTSSPTSQLQLDNSHSMTPPPLDADRGYFCAKGVTASSVTGPLQIATDINLASPPRSDSLGRSLSSAFLPVSRSPSIKRAIAAALGTGSVTNSRVASPVISAMGDVTPLPSPLLSGDSPGPWKRFANRSSSRDPMPNPAPSDSVIASTSGDSIGAAPVNAPKRKAYTSLAGAEAPAKAPDGQEDSGSVERHGRNRSISEYVPDPMAIPRRQSTVSGIRVKPEESSGLREPQIRREANLAESRGLTPTVVQPPTPPPSESSKDTADSSATERKPKAQGEYFEACRRDDGKRRRWRAIKLLGQGTFSRVMLATSQTNGEDDDQPIAAQPGVVTPTSDKPSPRRKSLVAVKVCEHGPKGGASEERIEMSLKRELEIMQSIHHPSLVHLKAWNIEPTRAILVLSHCPGGDLFDVATAHREVLQPALLRRMFSELVGAVRYLHDRKICHRDIKLENVLVNLTAPELADPSVDWTTYPYSVVTLTDLGLSRRIADDEKLETRCGSEDYAAPEVIMGLPYDGRATDAWSLGVLLYALLESRLPFDPYPGTGNDGHRMRSRTSHRIARAEWRWIQYAGDDGNHDGSIAKFEEKGMLGAMEITEGLLMRARTRWSLEKVASNEWVAGAIQVDGGIQFREEDEGEEVQ